MTQTNFTFDEDLEQIRAAQMAVLAEIDEINMRSGLPLEIEKITDANLGKGRYLLRLLAPKLAEELAA